MDISTLSLALGSSLTAGLNLYITVLTLGLLHRYEFFALPSSMEILANPWVLGVAAVLLVVEFFADKIPYIDSAWDFAQGFIRIPAGVVLAASAVGDVPAQYVWMAGLAGGFVSFTSHGAKATTRLAANASPEPFSNWFLSFFEDGLSLVVLLLIVHYPMVALILVLALLAIGLVVIVLFFGFFRMIFRRRAARRRPAHA
jgi:uncharacterized membrane protein